jgi:hypothetical protein
VKLVILGSVLQLASTGASIPPSQSPHVEETAWARVTSKEGCAPYRRYWRPVALLDVKALVANLERNAQTNYQPVTILCAAEFLKEADLYEIAIGQFAGDYLDRQEIWQDLSGTIVQENLSYDLILAPSRKSKNSETTFQAYEYIRAGMSTPQGPSTHISFSINLSKYPQCVSGNDVANLLLARGYSVTIIPNTPHAPITGTLSSYSKKTETFYIEIVTEESLKRTCLGAIRFGITIPNKH